MTKLCPECRIPMKLEDGYATVYRCPKCNDLFGGTEHKENLGDDD